MLWRLLLSIALGVYGVMLAKQSFATNEALLRNVGYGVAVLCVVTAVVLLVNVLRNA